MSEVELPRGMKDILMDDVRKLRLDAKEFLSDVRVLDCRQARGPIFEIIWLQKVMMVPYDRPHVMRA